MAKKDKEEQKETQESSRDREIGASFRQQTRRRTRPTASRDRERELLTIFERMEEEFRRALIEDVGLVDGSPEFERAIQYRGDLEP